MEIAFVVGSVVWNTGIISITGYFIKKWMDRQEAGIAQTREDAKESCRRLTGDLKETVIEHKAELKASSDQLDVGLKEIFTQLRIANGRTAKLEGELGAVIAVCKERHGVSDKLLKIL